MDSGGNVLVDRAQDAVGMVGAGLMGSRMARRLAGAGWAVTTWNRGADALLALEKDGLKTSGDLPGLARGCTVLMSCLANDEAVRSVYMGERGIFANAKAGTILLELSTISIGLSAELHRESQARGLRMLDLPVSGSTPALEAGAVTLLAGGEGTLFEGCVPIFEALAKQWFLIGPATSGIRMKLVINLMLGIEMQGIAEALRVGTHMAIDRGVMLDVLSKSAAVPPALVKKFAKIGAGEFSPEFPLRLLAKDIDLVVDEASGIESLLPVTERLQATLRTAAVERGDFDISVLAALEGAGG